ncbi:MAG TPA: T9SS type A sorting domain-containing protein, partial [Candidatus Marinimicrobia bacterium]|nr:T9SS type A sorting domain-containing protein [Candidatus Neomarinimicrobiota bacterium]
DTIIVHPGIYVENVDFGGKSIVLGSNWLFANDTTAVDSTIIDGNHSGPVVTISNGEDSTTALIGFTLRNGSGAAIGNYNKGGGIYIEGSRPSIRWVNIEDCAADGGWGGGVYISDSDVSLIRTNISRNHAQWGGGISAENSHLILRFTTLIDDSASGSGGGVYLNNVDLNARRFNGFNNVAALDGGGLFATGGSDVVIRLLMLNGNRANLGGALCFSDSSTIQLNNGNINLNNAENGGGIWASAVTGTIGAVRFQNNTAENLGGAMHLSSNSDLEATDMVVINNSANRGGGISILNSVGDFVGGEINNNYAWRGGGIFSNGSDLDFFSITLTQNNSEDIGGGLLSISTNLVMDSTNVTFNSSDSSSGGGIMCINNDSTATYEVVITNSLISRNNANNSGAGLYFRTAGDDSSGMDILIENTRIIRNDGDYYTGLRIYGLNTQFEVNNCTFRGNNAVQFASGAGFNGSCIGSVNHSLFAFNHAAIGGGNFNSGGASVWSGADVDFDHCTFANNTAAYGTALTVGAANAAVTNSIIWGNSTSNHVALDVWDGTGGTLDISYTDLLGGSQAIQLEDTELCSFSWGSGNLNEDPLFCLPDSGNFTLAENSPCVEAAEDRSNLGSFGIGCDPIILSTAGELLPTAYALHQNYPNPFNPVTTIQYDLPDNSQVQVAIYDMLGRKVRTLVSGFENAGFKAVQWQGKNDFGRSVGAGVYIYQIQAGDFLQTRKMILLK